MITVDSSALISILLDEPTAPACAEALAQEQDIKISAGTLAECLVVAIKRGRGDAIIRLIENLPLDILPVTAASARRAGEAYRAWGKGFHPAALNFGDCFAYEAAAANGGRLLYVGDDFARTDLVSVLDRPRP